MGQLIQWWLLFVRDVFLDTEEVNYISPSSSLLVSCVVTVSEDKTACFSVSISV